MFQFQSGAVKRTLLPNYAFYPPCFNSKVVRLKGGSLTFGSRFVKKFQFQSGAVKRHETHKIFEVQSRFNSKVVRLKEEKQEFAKYWQERFNSKVVRLKEQKAATSRVLNAVSIPKWCG